MPDTGRVVSILRDGAVSWSHRPHQPSLAARFMHRAYGDACVISALVLYLSLRPFVLLRGLLTGIGRR